MGPIVLPPGWEHHAAAAATLFETLGPAVLFWGAAALLLAAGVACLDRRPAFSVVLAVGATLALAIAANGLVDDSYIQFRYAANLAAGQGPVFNAAERLEGASGGIWIGAIALAVKATGIDAARCGRVLSVAAALLATTAAAAFGGALGGRRGAGLVAVLWAALPTAALYAATGLETAAFAGALWWAAAAAARDRPGPAAVAGILAATLRPEGLLLAACAAPFARRLGRGGRAAIGGGVAGGVAIAAARLVYYGLPLPRSALVKGLTAPAGPDLGVRYLGGVVLEWWPLLLLLPWIGLQWRRLLPVLVPTALWTGIVIARGGDWMPGGRYLLPLVILLAGSVAALPARRAASILAAVSVAWSLFALAPRAVPLEEWSSLSAGWSWRAMAEHRMQSRWWEALGAWLRAAAPEARLATGPSGALPYAAHLATFDLYGLCSAVTGRAGTEPGHRLWGLEEAVAGGADLIYPGRDLTLMEAGTGLLRVAEQGVVSGLDPLRDYRPVTILHAPEYRFDYRRDVIFVRGGFALASPGPPGVSGRTPDV